MFVRDGSGGLALYPYAAGPMRRLRLGATPDAPSGNDPASLSAWVTAVYQEVFGRPSTIDETNEAIRILLYPDRSYLPGTWTIAAYWKQIQPQQRSGYLRKVGPGDWVKSSGEHVTMPLAPASVLGAPAAPPPQPTTTATLGDSAQVVQVTLPSGPVVQGTQFQVSVIVKNVGGVVWGNGYTVQLVAPTGAPTANPVSFVNVPPLSPGGQATLTLTVWAPQAAGTYAYQFAVLNPSQQAVAPVGNVAVVAVPPVAASPTQVVQSTTDAVSRQEFDSYVSAALQNTQNVQHAVDALQQANIRGYQPTYTSIPGAPSAAPGQPIIMAAAPVEGPNWWLWGFGLAALGVGAWWYFGPKKKTGRQRVTKTQTVTTRTTRRRRRA